MATPWITNRYLTITRENFKLASSIGNAVAARLIGGGVHDPAIQALADHFEGPNDAYQAKYVSWSATKGVKQGATLDLQQNIVAMRAKVNGWRRAITNVYDDDSAEFKALMPDGVGPFYKGSQLSILSTIGALSINLSSIPALAAVKADVDATLEMLTTKNETQKGKTTAAGILSKQLESERKTLCAALLYVEGGLAQRFPEHPVQANSFLPLELLRRRIQTSFTGNIAAKASKCIVRRKQEADAVIRLHNIGNAVLTFYFAPTKNAALHEGMPMQVVGIGEDLRVDAASLGAGEDSVFLIVMNGEEDVDGRWVVEL